MPFSFITMTKKKIILLHGALGARIELQPLAKKLESAYEVHNLEFSGHGKTPLAGTFDINSFASELADYIRSNKLNDAKIFGYSMGGYVALFMAANSSIYTGEIVTLGTKFSWNPEVSAAEVKKLNPEKILEKVPKFADYLMRLHGENYWKEQMDLTAQLMLDLGNSELLHDKIGQITNVCRIGLGALDDMVSREETEHICKQLKIGTMHILPDTAHPINRVNLDTLVSFIG